MVRLNHRSCGGTEHLTRGVYHSGLTADPLAVMRALVADDGVEQFALAGYSLGGNIALKLAGELAPEDAARMVAIAAVSPPIDLAQCADALDWPSNVFYQWAFLRGLCRRMRRKAAYFPDTFTTDRLRPLLSVRDFDEAYTAPLAGYENSSDYWAEDRVIDFIAAHAAAID